MEQTICLDLNEVANEMNCSIEEVVSALNTLAQPMDQLGGRPLIRIAKIEIDSCPTG